MWRRRLLVIVVFWILFAGAGGAQSPVAGKWAESAKMPATELGRQLQAMLTRYGVTSAFDTGSSWETTRRIRDRVESGEVPGPRIRSAGEPLFAKGSFSLNDVPVADALGFMRYMPSEVGDAAEASAVAKGRTSAPAPTPSRCTRPTIFLRSSRCLRT